VVRTDRAASYTNFFGGQWTAVSEPFGDTLNFGALARWPRLHARFRHHFEQPQMERQPLQIYRRVRSP
jgi:hypothetical protein